MLTYKMGEEWNVIRGYFNNMNTIEFGGPTQLFWDNKMLPLYDKFTFIDNINNSEFDVFENTKDNHNSIFRINYNMDITNITFESIKEQYDSCISSHTIEHIANPILFLKNIQKLLKKNGLILTILPNKTQFWDRVREYTTMEHLVNDYKNNIKEDDLTHLEENINTDHPWKREFGVEEFIKRCKNNFKTRTLHHHCFNTELSKELHEYCGFETILCKVLANDPLQIVYIGKRKNV